MHDEREEARERRARSHSERVAILEVLAQAGCELTAPQIRGELPGEPMLGYVYYHLRVLTDTGLITAEESSYKLP